MATSGKYIVLTDWENYAYGDRRKNLTPPYPWYKQRADELDTLNRLDGRLFGALCRLRMLACKMGNCIDNRDTFLRGRCGVTRKTLAVLREHGLIYFTDKPPDPEKPKENKEKTPNPPEKNRTAVRTNTISEGDRDLDIKTEGPREGNLPSRRKPGDGTRRKRDQPKFEDMTKACMAADVRGSDFRRISDVIRDEFGFVPSENQVQCLETQIIDRRKE